MGNRKYYGYSITEAELGSVNRICVLSWGLLGDVLIRVPVIEALRKRFPNARIVVVVDPVAVIALKFHPDCDEVIGCSRAKRPLFKYIRETIKTISTLRRSKFDLCIDLYGGESSARLSRWIAADIRLSFDHRPVLRSANNLLATCPSFQGNWSKALGTMLEPLGVCSDAIRRGTSFYFPQEAADYAVSFFAKVGDNVVGFNLGAGADEKRWPVSRFVALAKLIYNRHGLVPLVFTNPGMENLAQEFEEQYSGHSNIFVVPKISLEKVGALMCKCDYIVTGDTSLMHMSFGLKRPTLILFTYTRPEIVVPEDCRYAACFVENSSVRDPYGQPYGTSDIPVDQAALRFEELVASE